MSARRHRRRHALRAIHLPNPLLADDAGLLALFRNNRRCSRRRARELLGQFTMHEAEAHFARTLLVNAPYLRVYRSNQRCFCGDFILIDMTLHNPEQRKVYVIDLKRNAPLILGGGGASNQFTRADQAVHAIARATGWIDTDCRYEKVVGDVDVVLNYLGVLRLPKPSNTPALGKPSTSEEEHP